MIEKITIKNVATYPAEGVTIDNLKKVNFIYGGNGSGKTTITNFIDSPDSPYFKDAGCELIWKNTASLKVLSYNKNFRDTNFGKGKMPGVFTLGNATKEHLDKIAEMQTKLATIKEEGVQKAATIKNQSEEKIKLDSTFQESCWTGIYKEFEDSFKPAFVGHMRKKAFKDKILSEFKSNKRVLKTNEELEAKAKIVFVTSPQQMSKIGIIDFSRLTIIERDAIWVKKIIGKGDVEISKLILRLNANDWVNQGRQLIDNDSEVCPFCQHKTIDINFRTQLEEYFDETFVADSKLVNALAEEYNTEAQKVSGVLQSIEVNELDNKKLFKISINY